MGAKLQKSNKNRFLRKRFRTGERLILQGIKKENWGMTKPKVPLKIRLDFYRVVPRAFCVTGTCGFLHLLN